MSTGKIVLLVVYAILAGLMLLQGDTSVGIWSQRILILIAAGHVVEVLVFFRFCQKAGGSLPVHLLNVLVFGVLHVKDLKEAQASA
jgi:uncharacterized protein YhhL (DUF1145 family)